MNKFTVFMNYLYQINLNSNESIKIISDVIKNGQNNNINIQVELIKYLFQRQ